MNCSACSYTQAAASGPFVEYTCAFTRAQVADQDRPAAFACPLALELGTQVGRIAARTVLVVAQREGLLRVLLAHYPEKVQDELRVILADETLDRPLPVTDGRRVRWQGRGSRTCRAGVQAATKRAIARNRDILDELAMR